jgi:hypothetical protein
MKSNAMNRLEKLEWSRGQSGSRIKCIEHVIVEADGRPFDPQFYSDSLGNRWTRGPGESAEAFLDRVRSEAIMRAQPKMARIIGRALERG